MTETEKFYEEAGFEKSEFRFNKQTGIAYVKSNEKETCFITAHDELVLPIDMDDPIRVYNFFPIPLQRKEDSSKDFAILNKATDHPTSTDYFEWIKDNLK